MASSKLTTKEGRLSARNFAARLTTSLRQFPADHFFRFEKKDPLPDIYDINNIQYAFFNVFIGLIKTP
jgi:hypothetical protein